MITTTLSPTDLLTLAAVVFTFLCGAAYEACGIILPGWHTISYTAHRNLLVRGTILGSVLSLFVILAIHFSVPIVK